MVIGGKVSFADSGLIQSSDVNLNVNAANQGAGYQAGIGFNFGVVSQSQSSLAFSGPSLPFGVQTNSINVYSLAENGYGSAIGATFGGSMNGALTTGMVTTGQHLFTN